MSNSPAVVFSSSFTTPKNNSFGDYIKYMDRSEAVRTERFSFYNIVKYDGYHDYMKNPEKSSGLFSSQLNNLDKSHIKKLKEQFEIAQKNDSVMWQDVISFNNDCLEKNGVYNKVTG